MITPHSYQQECLDALAHARQEHKKRALVVMASGLGKTVTAALDAKRWLQAHSGRVLYLCHQNDILEQARTTFAAAIGENNTFGYFNGREKNLHQVTCLFASFQTMREWREAFLKDEFDYIVVDETHHTPAPTYQPTVEYFEPRFLLAITATPERTDLQDIRQFYGQEAFSLPLEDALARYLLTPVDYRLMTDDIQLQEVFNTSIGKLSIRDLNKKIFVPKRDQEIARIIQQRAKEISNPRAMIFCPSVQYCERLVAHLPNALTIHYQLSDREQRIRLESFRGGLTSTILTVDKFNEGIDIPEANIIVFLRSTASRMVFFQQLGRGLRKVQGKDKVLVLDFVANCERLEMVHDLWQEVEEKRGGRKKKTTELSPLNLDVGRVHFKEEVKRVLDIIAAVRGGYTKEILIQQLQALALRLGHRPTIVDVNQESKAQRCANAATFRVHFGSFSRAVEEADLGKAHNLPRSKEELIRQLQSLAQELKRVPTVRDVNMACKAGKCANASTFFKLFGSFASAIDAAGLTKRDELISQLKSLAEELGRTPTYRDVRVACKEGKFSGGSSLQSFFGSFNAALEAAGLQPTLRHGQVKAMSKGELIGQLRQLADELSRPPTRGDVEKANKLGKCAGVHIFRRKFGTYGAAIVAAGIE